jgi:hypothetical protein
MAASFDVYALFSTPRCISILGRSDTLICRDVDEGGQVGILACEVDGMEVVVDGGRW